jgi:hypothetical protein
VDFLSRGGPPCHRIHCYNPMSARDEGICVSDPLVSFVQFLPTDVPDARGRLWLTYRQVQTPYRRSFCPRKYDEPTRPALDAARSNQPPAILPHCVFFMSQCQSEYAAWKAHSHSKASETNA